MQTVSNHPPAPFIIPLYSGPSINDFLDYTGAIPLISLDSNGRDIGDLSNPETFYLLPRLEGPGLPENK